MHLSNSSQPVGRRYAEAYRRLEQPWPNLAKIDKVTRNHALWLFENREEVLAWYNSERVSQRERDQWNHPTVIRRHYAPGAAGQKPRSGKKRPAALQHAQAQVPVPQEVIKFRWRDFALPVGVPPAVPEGMRLLKELHESQERFAQQNFELMVRAIAELKPGMTPETLQWFIVAIVMQGFNSLERAFQNYVLARCELLREEDLEDEDEDEDLPDRAALLRQALEAAGTAGLGPFHKPEVVSAAVELTDAGTVVQVEDRYYLQRFAPGAEAEAPPERG